MNTGNVYSVQLSDGRWVNTSWNIFRAWSGNRKVNNRDFVYKHFLFMSPIVGGNHKNNKGN